ncbi:ROK family protein, partial [Klebsiella michiganensis]
GEQAPAEAIIAAAQNGEPQALAHWRHFIDAFGRSLASVINILDPQVIVLGGGLSNVGQIYEQLPSAIVPYLFSDSCRTQIKQARFGDASGVRGAAWLPVLANAEAGRR